MQYDGLLGLAQDAVVNALVVGRAFGDAGQRTAGHDDQLAAEFFNCLHLRFIGADHLVNGFHIVQYQMVGAAA